MTAPVVRAEESLRADLDAVRTDLETLVRIPSIGFPGHDPAPVRESAEATRQLLEDAGMEHARLLEVEGAHPYVYADWLHAGPDAPTVLLYAHHDVQPVGTPDRWTSPPFEPTERDGRLYARGAADDKAGIMVHVAAVRAWLRATGGLPLNVKVIVEGEEEIGSPHLTEFLDAHAETLRSDVIVLADSVNWGIGWPAVTYALRGMGELYVTLRSLAQPVHSGMWGGPVPDAFTAMSRLLATLHDERGEVAVKGFHDDVREPTDAERARLHQLGEDAETFRTDVRLLDGVEFTGDPDATLWERVWFRPTITPIGIDAPSVTNASNQLLSEVRVKLSLRFAPGQDPERVLDLVSDHLRAHVPWGLQLELRTGERNPAWVVTPEGPAFEAAIAAMTTGYGREPALIGSGGSIPFVQPFSDAFGGAPCLLVGVEDPATNAHGEDESLHLEDFANACVTEVHLFQELADRAQDLRKDHAA